MDRIRTRVADADDIPALEELEARYYVGNLDPGERGEGYLSVLHSTEWFTDAVTSRAIHIAESDGVVGGFIAVTAPPARVGPSAGPLTRAVLELVEVVEFRGAPIAGQRWALRGPVVIDRAVRGYGVYEAFNDVTRAAYRDRYDVGVLFVAADNPRSLHTTTTKLGARSLTEFEADGRRYHLLAYRFDSRDDERSCND